MRKETGYKIFAAILVATGVVLVFFSYLLKSNDASEATSDAVNVSEERNEGPIKRSWAKKDTSKEASAEERVLSQQEMELSDPARRQKIEERLKQAQINIAKLEKLASNAASRKDALAYARRLLKNGIRSERQAAIKALELLGGHDAVTELLPYLADGDQEVADNVDMALRNMIEESLYTDKRIMDKEAWLEALKVAGNEESMSVYLTLMSAFSELEAVPVLLEMFNSDKALDKKLAQEYMEFMAHGEAIADAKEAQAWWKKWMDEKGITEQDLKDYQDITKQENSAAKDEADDASKDSSGTEDKK